MRIANYPHLLMADGDGRYLLNMAEQLFAHVLAVLGRERRIAAEEEALTDIALPAARRALEMLVGNELAMQLRINLSIQLPSADRKLPPMKSA